MLNTAYLSLYIFFEEQGGGVIKEQTQRQIKKTKADVYNEGQGNEDLIKRQEILFNMIPVEPTPNFSSLSLSYFPLICIMEYISSDQSSISSLSRKENVSHFEFNVTSPILESKKTKTKKIGKLVDQVKKFKKQAPRIHNDIHNDDIGCHGDNNPISIFDAKEAAAGVANTAAGTEFFVSEAPTYKSNYSESVYIYQVKHVRSCTLLTLLVANCRSSPP